VRFFTKHDLCSGYHQVLMHPDDIERTRSKCTEGSLSSWSCCSASPTCAPATTSILLLSDLHKEFVVECNSSGWRFNVILLQGSRVVPFFSKQIALRGT
jgi:hypothetical protein